MATNVDKELHTDGDATDRESENPKRGLKGAAGGTYIGPVRPNSTSHATGVAAGGVEDSTGYRESDSYNLDGAGAGVTVSNTRPTSRTAYTGRGVDYVYVVTLAGVTAADSFKLHLNRTDTKTAAFVAGTNMTAAAMQTALRTLTGDNNLTVTGTTDAGPFLIVTSQRNVLTVTDESGLTGTVAKFAQHTPTLAGDNGHALGSDGRGTSATGTGPADTITGETVTINAPITPAIQTSANPSAGTIAAVVNGTAIELDEHATDVTNYAGAEIIVFEVNPDNTAEDGDYVGKADRDSATQGGGVTGLAAGTYAVYARYLVAATSPATGKNPGPLSARATVTIS